MLPVTDHLHSPQLPLWPSARLPFADTPSASLLKHLLDWRERRCSRTIVSPTLEHYTPPAASSFQIFSLSGEDSPLSRVRQNGRWARSRSRVSAVAAPSGRCCDITADHQRIQMWHCPQHRCTEPPLCVWIRHRRQWQQQQQQQQQQLAAAAPACGHVQRQQPRQPLLSRSLAKHADRLPGCHRAPPRATHGGQDAARGLAVGGSSIC